MKTKISILLVAMLAVCQSRGQQPATQFPSIKIDTLLSGKFSIRAIEPDGNKLWYAADNSEYGYIDIDAKRNHSFSVAIDSLEFRSIAVTRDNVFMFNVGSPAYLFRVNKRNKKAQIVYRDDTKDAFYDSMHFWNKREGIAIGDPINNCLSILITKDSGKTWIKLRCDHLPAMMPGEAAFAASNSNISIVGDKTWIVSGGQTSRVFYSPDKGQTWEVYQTPIIGKNTMTGIFSSDFYDGKIGFIAGGDYEKQLQNSGNKAITFDGGKTWKLVAENSGPGYISCVRFIPQSNGKQLMTVGATGLYYSADSGATWTLLHKDDSLYTIRFLNPNTAIAAGRNKIIRIRLNKKEPFGSD